jgi:hypothetical protein
VVVNEVSTKECAITWYECPTTLGRTYTLITSPCEVFVTSFENGLLAQEACDAATHGSASFCFGKIYDTEVFDADPCTSSFAFDGHRFIIEGNPSISFGAFDCSSCWPTEFAALEWNADAAGDQDLPEAPPEAESEEPDEEASEEEGSSFIPVDNPEDDEQRIIWDSGPTAETGVDTTCLPAEEISTPDDCESRDNPAVATLPSGHALIAYEDRATDGSTIIKLGLVDTTVDNRIYYYRSLSRGRLLNDDSIAYGVGTFEVYDDILIETTNDIPQDSLKLGFLTGPLAGGFLFNIATASREEAPDGRFKWVFTFDPGARTPSFTDSNDAHDVAFIITTGSLTDPSIGTLLELPAHLDNNNDPVPVAHPSIAVAQNAHMIDSSQNVYVSYQAFIDGEWKVYVRHLTITERNAAAPAYLSPYSFAPPSFILQSLPSLSDVDEVIYRVVDYQTSGSNRCVLFEVFLPDNRQVFNCTEESGTYIHDCGLEANRDIVSVELVYLDDCTSEWPSLGDEFTGPWNPVEAATFVSDPACIQNISQYPISTNNWCVREASCTQYFLFDDPYCPSPYADFLDVLYKPADLWTIKTESDWVTRVKYNMSATVIQEFSTEGISPTIDFMFLIDHSGSMSAEISKVRDAVPLLAQTLQDAGFDVRFGFAIYARKGVGSPPNVTYQPSVVAATCDDQGQPVTQSGPSIFFDGLQGGETLCGIIDASEEVGFTRDIPLLTQALGCWWESGYARAQHWAAIQWAIGDTTTFSWRPEASKFLFIITDTDEEETPGDNICDSWTDVKADAEQAIYDNSVQFIVARKLTVDDIFSDVSQNSGWPGSSFYDIDATDYGVVFQDIASNIVVNLSGLSILERDEPGYDPTFMKLAEVIITYDGDLLDKWTNDRTDFNFNDRPPVDLTRADKGLSNMPFSLYDGRIYGIDKVHTSANFANWIYYDSPGPLKLSYPSVGIPSQQRSEPLLVDNGRRPQIKVNNHNAVLVAYEKTEFGIPQIKLKGTGDLHYGGIIGPPGGRITRLLAASDFVFEHDITLSGEGVNQLCDIVVDKSDVVHVVWQSNRDTSWEIYYANSSDLFEPIRVTSSTSRSSAPRIDVADDGTIYVVYNDNRFGPFEVMLSYKDERRILPLVQQDAYLASLRANYRHYTNTIPILVTNEGTPTPIEGLLWATKTASGDGNANENYIFSIPDAAVGDKERGGDTSPYEIVALAGARDGYMYGITSDGKLLLLANPIDEDPYLDVDPTEIEEIGDIAWNTTGLGELIHPVTFEDNFEVGAGKLDTSADWNDTWFSHTGQGSPGSNSFAYFYNYLSNDHIQTNNVYPPSCYWSSTGGSSTVIWRHTRHTATTSGTRDQIVQADFLWNTSGNPTARFGFDFRKTDATAAAFPFYSVYLHKGAGTYDLTAELMVIQGTGAGWYVTDTQTVTVAAFSGNNWTQFQVWCYNDGSDVKFDIYIGDILYFTLSHNPNSDGALNATEKAVLNGNAAQFPSGYFAGFMTSTFIVVTASSTYTCWMAMDNFHILEVNETPTLETKQTPLDATVDPLGRLWASVIEEPPSGGAYLKMYELDTSNAQILREGTLFDSDITARLCGVSCLNTNIFYFTAERSGVITLYKSDYPFIGAGSANFVLNSVTELDASIRALASDFEDTLYGLDRINRIYLVDTSDGTTTKLTNLSDPETGDPYFGADPVGTLAGFGYQFTGIFVLVGDPGYFHVLIEFYDNINLDGSPAVTIDSREDLESFINVAFEVDDPYVEEAYFAGARGVYLRVGESRYIAFDASHYRPGYSRLAHPYAFDTNQTYFPRVFVIAPTGNTSLVNEMQTVSFSCNRCTRLGDNIFDSHGCSYSWVIDQEGVYNFYVDFYTDPGYINNIERYVAEYGHSDLAYFEVNNKQATDEWGENGLDVGPEAEPFIQIYPTLNPSTGLLCGIPYYVKVTNSETGAEIESARGSFFCECSTNIFPDHVQALSEIGRWHSSAHGYADTRVTDSPHDSVTPAVKTRSSGAAIIAFEDRDNPDSPTIRAATFRKAEPIEFFGSGTKSWFDYDFDIIGQNPDLAIDLYDRAIMTYETSQQIAEGDLPRNSVFAKACNFAEEGQATDVEFCDIESLTSNVITRDDFVVSSIIKRVLVKPDFVDYYTYTASGNVAAVVSECKIKLQIWGSQELVAYRLKNEMESNYSDWCAVSPQVSDYMTETDWTLSQGSGVKEICVQAMTYNGVTVEFCVPIIADYSSTTFEVKLYADESYSELLPIFNSMYVAATLLDTDSGSAAMERTIYVEIIPSRTVEFTDIHEITYDVLQQGDNDLFDQVAIEQFPEGRQVFRGSFTIHREDNVSNVDGLARVRVSFPDECQAETAVAFGSFTKDSLNLTSRDTQFGDVTAEEDALDPYRQDISGRIGAGTTIRPNEDPYFIFGDPNFYLKKEDPTQHGVARREEGS